MSSHQFPLSLFLSVALLASFGFAATQFARQQSVKLRTIDARLAALETKAGSISSGPFAKPDVSGVTFDFTCDEMGSGKTSLIKVVDGKTEVIADGIEKFPTNEHPGDCFHVVSSDAADRYAEAKKLYLVQTALGDAGTDGYYEFDLASTSLVKSKLVYPSTYHVISDDKRYQIVFSPADAQEEVRSLELIDFQRGTTKTIARLSDQYSYTRLKTSNELEGTVNVYGDIDLRSWRAEVAVYSVKDESHVCGLYTEDPNVPSPSCKERVPVFKLIIDPSNPEKIVK